MRRVVVSYWAPQTNSSHIL